MSWIKKQIKWLWSVFVGVAIAVAAWIMLKPRGAATTTTNIDIKHRKDPKDEEEADDIIDNIDSMYD